MKLEPVTPLGLNLVVAMRVRGLTLAQLARDSGVHAYTATRVVRGDYEPKLETVYAWAAALKCEAWELLKPGHFEPVARAA